MFLGLVIMTSFPLRLIFLFIPFSYETKSLAFPDFFTIRYYLSIYMYIYLYSLEFWTYRPLPSRVYGKRNWKLGCFVKYLTISFAVSLILLQFEYCILLSIISTQKKNCKTYRWQEIWQCIPTS